MKKKIKKIGFHFREDNELARSWHKKISKWISVQYPSVKITERGFDALVVLGGDGTMLEAARICHKSRALMIGLNLGTVGFLTSVRESKKFLPSLRRLLEADYRVSERSMLEAHVYRKKKQVFTTTALNEVVVMNPLGIVTLLAGIDGHAFQEIRGTGALVATATGSTAYNLSAHGPVIMPDSKNIIFSELLDHNLPTPSIVLKDSQEIEIVVSEFRERGLLSISATNAPVDVVLVADGDILFPLNEHDMILLRRTRNGISVVEFEPNYFIQSLHEKFSFK